MSGRMLRKVLREQEKLTVSPQFQSNGDDDADSNDSSEPARSSPPVNRFDLLDTQAEEDTYELNDVDSDQEDSKPGTAGEDYSHVSTSAKPKNKKKKKQEK